VSSTSVYANLNTIVNEEEGAELGQSALYQIEQLFSNNTHFLTTVVRFSGLIGYKRHPGRVFCAGKSGATAICTGQPDSS
ncbi:[similarity to] dTDP-glucose 4,6-dehydratase, partial [methanotrophic bacterial endosymbiont of Bathymodiolus sp.]